MTCFGHFFSYMIFLLATVLLAFTVSAQPATAAPPAPAVPIRTVKAGFFAFPGYHQLDNGIKSGYGYDFLTLLQRYSHLKIAYVGYDNSWEEMQQMLQDGKVDILTSARKTQEREKLFDFSMPIGLNSAQINVRKNDERFIPGDFAALNGITIGILRGNSRNADTQNFAAEKGFAYQTVEFDSVETLQQALADGKVDAIATSSLRKSSQEKTIAEFAPQKFYAIVRKGDTALLNEINYGINQMDVNEGNWRDDLYYTNYVAKAGTVLAFTQREQAYIKAVQNGEKSIIVTARPNRNPYSFVENGRLVGIIPDYFANLMKKAGLPYTVQVPRDRDEYGRWQAEFHTPVFIDYHYDASRPWSDDNGLFTRTFMELTLSRVTRIGFTGEENLVARIDSQPEKDIRCIRNNTPEYLTVASAEAAMTAVQDGKADSCYVPTYIAEKIINADPDTLLTYTILKDPVYYANICLSPDADHELCSILNKCITNEATSVLSEYVTKYTTVSLGNLSLAQYLKRHPAFVFLTAAVLALLITFIAILVAKSKITRIRAEKLEAERVHAEELHLHAFGEMVNAVTWSIDVKGDHDITDVFWSAELRHMFGFDNETDFPNVIESWSDRLHPEDKPRILEHFHSCIANQLEGLVYDVSFRLQRKNGDYCWYHAYGRTESKADHTRRLYGIIVDVSAEKRLEEQQDKLNEALTVANEEKLRNDIIHDIIHSGKWAFFVNPQDQVIRADYSCEVQHVINNDLANEPDAWTKILHPDDREATIAAFQASIADHSGQTPYDVTYRMIDRHGSYHWFHSAGRIKRDDHGNGEFFGVHIDITDQVEEQQKRLLGAIPLSSDILSKANIGLWAFELDEGQPPRMYVDDTMLGLIGLDHQLPPEETYHAWYDHIDKNSYPIVTDAVAKMTSGEHAEVQYPWHHPNGQTMIVRCGGIRNPEYTKGIRVEGAHQNITEMLHFDEEQQRQEKENFSLNLISSLSDTITALYYITPETGAYQMITRNDEYGNHINSRLQHGGNFYEDVPPSVKAVVFPEDWPKMDAISSRENIEKAFGDSESFTIEYRLVINQKPVWYRIKFVKIHDTNGETRYTLGVMSIQEEMRRQEQLQNALFKAQEETQRNDLLYDISKSGKWSYDISVDDQVIAAHYADKTQQIVDKTYTGIPMGWVNLLHPDDKERVLADFMAAIHDHTGKTPYDTTFRVKGEDGRYRWNKSAGRVIRHQDGTGELFGMTMNITEQIEEQEKQQKQLQEALVMAQSASRAKTTFLNNMSHDIRTPMNAIIGFTGLAASHIDNKAQVQDYLMKISQSSDHLLSLINDVLDMSRIESGKMNLDEKEENLPAIIHTLRDIVQADIRAKQHDFFIDTVNVNNENIICDKLRLNQVLLNILSNAIKYTANGGTISMRITEKAVKPSGYATFEFCIKDNGMGMDTEYLKTIFDPFTRVKSSTVSGIQGTGLGMAITKNIIDMMGGTIDIQSAPGKGTQMTVTFDFRLVGTQNESPAIPELKGLRGLVVDDNSDTCMSLTGMLRDIGMRGEWCVSGKEAVLRAAEACRIGDHFKVFVIDWLMPDMNGIETTRRIRKVIGDDAPIIILTAYDWSDIEEEAHEAGVTAFVSKPMFPSDLHRVLNQCLGKTEKQESPQEDDFDFTGKKVLLVEDNPLNREIAIELLEEYGMTVTTAEDGTVAVEKMKAARDGDYDVILMDIQMPIMNGYEATRQIRALGTPISQIPILAMTADAFAEDRKQAITAGMNDHITKPINVTVLRQTLAKFL